MTKVDIISGFLGAGKTTFIKQLVQDVFAGEKLVLIENEFGEIGIDGGFLKDAGIEITEMNSGCICCTLVGDFSKALVKVLDEYKPDRVIIEPSGVGKLSDVARAIEDVKKDADIEIEGRITIVDGKKAKMYLKNFGEFFKDQVEHASTIVVSRTQMMTDEKVEDCVKMLREENENAAIISTPWDQLGKEAIQHALHAGAEIEGLFEDKEGHGHHEHHHDHDHDHEEHGCCGHHEHPHDHEDHDHEEHGCCGHHEHHHDHDHDHEEHGCCGHHEHHHDHDHDHEEHGCCGHHEHHHDHDHECGCGCGHDHDHHHHHHADDVFTSWGKETAHKYTEEELDLILKALSETDGYGTILRSKGIIAMEDGTWRQFDLVPEEYETRECQADYTGRICVIGTDLKEEDLMKLFHL